MILRGIVLPSLSLRRPVSMTCETRVLICTISPFLASLGTFRRGFSAIAISRYLMVRGSAAAAADRHLHFLLAGIEFSVARLSNDDHVLGGGEPDASDRLGAARERRETERREPRARIAVGHHQDVGHVVLGRHRAVDYDQIGRAHV